MAWDETEAIDLLVDMNEADNKELIRKAVSAVKETGLICTQYNMAVVTTRICIDEMNDDMRSMLIKDLKGLINAYRTARDSIDELERFLSSSQED